MKGKTMKKRKRTKKNKNIKIKYLTFRCTSEFKERVQKIAKKKGVRTSTLLELFVSDGVLKFLDSEKSL